jgi:hypothetical protein
LRETITILKDNGFIVYQDLAGNVSSRREDLEKEVNAEMLRWRHWIPTIQSVVQGWGELRRSLKKVAGSEYNENCHVSGGIRDYLLANGKPVNYENIENLENIILSKKKSHSHVENEIIKTSVRFYIEYAFSNIIARADINEPFFDWRHLGDIYVEKMRLTGLGQRQNEMRCATGVFFCAAHLRTDGCKATVSVARRQKAFRFQNVNCGGSKDRESAGQRFCAKGFRSNGAYCAKVVWIKKMDQRVVGGRRRNRGLYFRCAAYKCCRFSCHFRFRR